MCLCFWLRISTSAKIVLVSDMCLSFERSITSTNMFPSKWTVKHFSIYSAAVTSWSQACARTFVFSTRPRTIPLPYASLTVRVACRFPWRCKGSWWIYSANALWPLQHYLTSSNAIGWRLVQQSHAYPVCASCAICIALNIALSLGVRQLQLQQQWNSLTFGNDGVIVHRNCISGQQAKLDAYRL